MIAGVAGQGRFRPRGYSGKQFHAHEAQHETKNRTTHASESIMAPWNVKHSNQHVKRACFHVASTANTLQENSTRKRSLAQNASLRPKKKAPQGRLPKRGVPSAPGPDLQLYIRHVLKKKNKIYIYAYICICTYIRLYINIYIYIYICT